MMYAIMGTLLKQVQPNAISMQMKNFCERHKSDTNLISIDLWDADVIKYVKLELLFISKCRYQFFNTWCELDKSNLFVATSKYLE